ncbi:site-specific DNA-methyltransferase [Larkinella arboricola]|nr:site-specific DNA-methyltransferase [Larkinella arboricola]
MQTNLNLNARTRQEETTVENYQFEPIKGYPMLQWQGKRPFTSTQFYPAQLKETYGEETDGWINQIFWGDNLQVMSHLLKKFRGQVDLIYIDPPFDSKADYKKKIQLRGKAVANDATAFEEKQYTDIWTNDEYLQFMYERLVILRELLAETGSLYLHCDYHKNHYLRCLLDEVFGQSNFKNEIIWKRRGGRTTTGESNLFESVTETIFWYVKSENYTYHQLFSKEESEKYIKEKFTNRDADGRLYQLTALNSPNPRPNLIYDYKGYKPHSNGWSVSYETMLRYEEEGKLYFPEDKTKRIRRKQYLDEWEGKVVQSLWTDVFTINSQAEERVDYPTQKPEALLERILKTSTNPGDLVFDCFMGSGTTQAVAMKLGRRFLGADINLGAIQTTTKRLVRVAQELNAKLPDGKVYTGFQVYNVNHYDVFRNPLEAKEILMKALEVEPAPAGGLWDGEKDGRMVKVMPVNRIATRADLNDLLANIDLRAYQIRKDASPNRPVEHITLVCMGHEPDLAAQLKAEVKQMGYLIDVEVVDVLRDRSKLEFKRDAEAVVTIENNQLLIREFYPMNLLQKLSLMKEDAGDWKELVESVLIDWNYDGAVLEPTTVDIPEGNALVRGVYPLPANHGTIRVKITDLLSESLELTVEPF